MTYTTNYVVLFSVLLGIFNQGNAMQKVAQIADSPFKEYLDRALLLDVVLPNNSLECTKTLLACRANVNVREQGSGLTPIHYAARLGFTHVLQLLINDTAYQNDVIDNSGSTPLMMAALSGSYDCVRLLIGAGACIKRANLMQETALHCAATSGRCESVQLLINRRSCVNAQMHLADRFDINFGKFTPLHCAAYYGHTNVVQLLINQKANIYLKTTEQETAYDLAHRNKHNDIVSLLAHQIINDFESKVFDRNKTVH